MYIDLICISEFELLYVICNDRGVYYIEYL